MTAASVPATSSTIALAGGQVHILQGGRGAPLWVLHHDFGPVGWLPFHEQLAASFSVTAPDLPGYGRSERPEWMMSLRDEAVAVGLLIDRIAPAPVTLVGLGFGGWVAAEVATMQPSRLSRLVLVGPMGLKPREGEGEIFDQFLVAHKEYLLAGLHDREKASAIWGEGPGGDFLVELDLAREMSARIAWKPYLFSLTLAPFLREVRVPALVVAGEHDAIVPRDCARQYAELLPSARLEIVPGAGHLVEVEQPEALARLITQFANS